MIVNLLFAIANLIPYMAFEKDTELRVGLAANFCNFFSLLMITITLIQIAKL